MHEHAQHRLTVTKQGSDAGSITTLDLPSLVLLTQLTNTRTEVSA